MEKTTSDVNRSISSFKSNMHGTTSSGPTSQTIVTKISIPQNLKNLAIGFLSFISLCSFLAAYFCGISACRGDSNSSVPEKIEPEEIVIEVADSAAEAVDSIVEDRVVNKQRTRANNNHSIDSIV